MISWSLNAASLGLLRGRACTLAHGFVSCHLLQIAAMQQECHATQVRTASTRWRCRRGGGLGHQAPSEGSDFTLAYLRQSVFSCPRAPGASCSARKASSITWIGSIFPFAFLIASCMSVRVANGSMSIASSNM